MARPTPHALARVRSGRFTAEALGRNVLPGELNGPRGILAAKNVVSWRATVPKYRDHVIEAIDLLGQAIARDR